MEIEAARTRNNGVIPEGLTIPEAAIWHTALGAGEAVRRQVTVSIPEAGFYRVLLQVETGPGVSSDVDGNAVDGFADHEIWLEVTEAGGRVTDRAPNPVLERPSKVPPRGTRGGAGPLRADGVVPLDLCMPDDPTPCTPPPPPPTPGRLSGRLRYTNSVTHQVTPLRSALIVLQSWGGVQLASTRTDASGYYLLEFPTCPTGNPYLLSANTQDSDVRVQTAGGSTNISGRFVWPEDCNTTMDLGSADDKHSEAFDNFNTLITASRSYSHSAANRGLIKVTLRPDLQIGSGYDGGGADSITLTSDGMSGYRGIFVTAHEYGHAVHEKALGGIPLVSCPGLHFIFSPQSPLACAWTEGFADFHAFATRPHPASNGDYSNDSLQQNAYWNNPREPSPSKSDGSTVEGAIAAFLLDVADGTGEDKVKYAMPTNWTDGLQVPTDYLAKVIRSCEVEQYGSPVQAGLGRWVDGDDADFGADYLIYCLRPDREFRWWYNKSTGQSLSLRTNVVDRYVRENYFPARRAKSQYAFRWYDETTFEPDPPFSGYNFSTYRYSVGTTFYSNLFGLSGSPPAGNVSPAPNEPVYYVGQ